MNDEMIRRGFFDEIDSTPTASFRVALRELLLDGWDDPRTLIVTELTPTQPERRHRWPLIAVIAAVVAIVVGGLVIATGNGDPTGEVPVDQPTTVATDTAATTLVRDWGRFHWGWVLVYGDGRLIWGLDIDARQPGGASWGTTVERYLTATGLDYVLSLPSLADDSSRPSSSSRNSIIDVLERTVDPRISADWWADPEFTVYEPASYAVCPYTDDEHDELADPTTAIEELPAPVQDLLRGTRLSTITEIYPGSPAMNGGGPPTHCFTLPAEHAPTLVQLADSAGIVESNALAKGEGAHVRFEADDGTSLSLSISPLLPHGQVVRWTG
jgi:hypothetical protein